ncbi:hypothetical protein F5Y17DRAFT_474950 [Xylariaceae sp. FL0594]|nr:hypothetical protein F5Y17DRAFT_474950 [Xylariaceae sp. FL0594]
MLQKSFHTSSSSPRLFNSSSRSGISVLFRVSRIRLTTLHCGSIEKACDASHVRQIDSSLKEGGILKISLGFQDDDCTYLKRLLLNLHENHGHGLPITHSASRGWFWDVRPQLDKAEIVATSPATARSETMENFPWNTDCSYELSPPRYFALQVLHADQCGGGTLSVLEASCLLKTLSPTVVESLCRPEFMIAVPPEFIKSEEQKSIVGSVLSVDRARDTVQLRFRQDIIHALTARGEVALEELRKALTHSNIKRHVLDLSPDVLPRGSIVLIDNRRWLHARSQVRDQARHLRRVRWDAQPFPTM